MPEIRAWREGDVVPLALPLEFFGKMKLDVGALGCCVARGVPGDLQAYEGALFNWLFEHAMSGFGSKERRA